MKPPESLDQALVNAGSRSAFFDGSVLLCSFDFDSEFGHFKDALRAEDKMVHAAPPEFVARARELLAGPHPETPDGYPFQLGNGATGT